MAGAGEADDGGMGPVLEAELYARVADAAPLGFAVLASDGRLLSVSGALARLWGLSPEEAEELRRLGPSAAAREALYHALARRTADPDTFRCGSIESPTLEDVALLDGRVLEREVVLTRDPGGQPTGFVAFFRDVSARRAAERELRDRARQQAALAALAEAAMNAQEPWPLLAAACATVTEILAVDAAAFLEDEGEAEALVIRGAAGLPAEAVGELVAPSPERWAQALAPGALLAGGAERPAPLLAHRGFACAAEVALPGREGPRALLGAYARRARAFSPDELRFLETAASVVASALARGRAEAEALDRERQMRAVFDGALDGMLLVDDQGAIRDANAAAVALLGGDRRALLGQPLDGLVAARGSGAPLAELARRGGRVSAEIELGVPGHRVRSVELAAAPDVVPGRHLCALRDVSELKRLHARLALADRMVSAATLAAGVAHELNNPLAYVSANLSFLADGLERLEVLLAAASLPAPDEARLIAQLRDAARDAREGAGRMQVIVRDLRTFSRGGEDRVGPVELRPVLESCVNMAWSEIRHRARLVKDLGEVPPVRGNEARLGQVFLNLLVNAAQAIPEGNAKANEIRLVARALPGGRVAVEVRDTGSGIPPELLPRVFDPFFTTKEPQVGTGLGLAICQSIVSGLGGELSAESQVGRGTTFRVTLLAADPEARPSAAAAAGGDARRRILVVDDEPLVGTAIQRALHAEHDVTVVSSARAALDLLAQGDAFDLVLSDLLMPEMTGMDLHRELVRLHPGLAARTVFLTGGAFTPAAREFLAREAVECVEKPFDLGVLRRVLARKLGVEPAPPAGRP